PGPGSDQGSQVGSGPGRAESGRQPDQGGGSGGPAPERPAQFRHVDRPVRRRGHQTLGGPRGHRQGSVGPPLTVTRTDVVRILLDIPERDVPLVNATEQNPNKDGKGDLVTLHIPALRSVVSNGEFTGHITRLASALDPQTRTIRAEVHLDNKGGHLRPGMYGTATVLLEERDYALTVPSTALVRRGNKVQLFYVDNPRGDPPCGVVRRLEVELGLDDGRRVEIRSPQLTGKEQIIAKGNGVVREGDTVIAVPAPLASDP